MLDTDNTLKCISDCVKCPYMMIIKKNIYGLPQRRSGDVHIWGPGTFQQKVRQSFFCPGLAPTFSLVRAMSVDPSYRWTSTKKVRGRPHMRSGDVPAEGPPESFLCPGLASTFSLVRAMSVDHSYRFLKMLTILENVTILYSCDKVDKILKLGKILKFRRNSEM